jgi:outer membrane biosynthesis protein TonB
VPDTPAATTSGKSSLGFLGRKIGPVPVWLIAVAAVAAWYWYQNYGPGKASSSTDSTEAIDPQTNVPYAEELGEAQQQITDLESAQPYGSGSSSPPEYGTPVTAKPKPPAKKPEPKPKPKPPVRKPVSGPRPARPPRRSGKPVTARPRTAAAADTTGAPATRWRAA